jgi:RimJ/RimL family protein N-acetyltransferase
MECILETQRLYLRELTRNDAVNLSLVLSDKGSMIHYPHELSLTEVGEWIDRNINRYKNDGFGLWAVIRKEDNQFLGDCGITLQNIDNKILPEIGFHIISEYCKMGYATEAAGACKDYATRTLGFRSVYSYSRFSNIASQRVSQKIGMKKIKTYSKDRILLVVFGYSVCE